MSVVDDIRADLRAVADPRRAEALRHFFQIRPGGYGEGDDVLGVTVPQQRAVARRHGKRATVADAAALLADGLHEERLTAIFLLVQQYRRGDDSLRRTVHETVLTHLDRVNNWDLVDSLAPYVTGPWLLEHPEEQPLLDRLAASDSVWERRMAVMATFAFVRAGDAGPTLRLAERLLHDPHDLVHKAVGWMLREVGDRDRAAEEAFLTRHHQVMPRTMLRYAIEKFPPADRQRWLRRPQ